MCNQSWKKLDKRETAKKDKFVLDIWKNIHKIHNKVLIRKFHNFYQFFSWFLMQLF